MLVGLPALAAAQAPARAQEPTHAPDATVVSEGIEELDPYRIEFALIPGAAVSTETGFGFGATGAIAGFHPDYAPYQWRLQASANVSVREGLDGDAEWPVQSFWLLYDFPELGASWFRLSGKVGYRRCSALGWYGLGNASVDAVPDGAPLDHLRYDRWFPEATVIGRATLGGGLSVFAGSTFTYSHTEVFAGSRLEQDLADPAARELLTGVAPHGLLRLKAGVIYDSRDHETSPTSGMWHEASIEGGAGLGEGFGFGRLNVTARFYAPIWGPHLVVATRLLADVMVGDPPFYELSAMGGFTPVDGPAGAFGIRGVPSQRLSGEVKLLGNLELRSHIVAFEVLEQRFRLGAVAFADTGRVFTELLTPHPELDGSDVDLHSGFGGGIRIQWGETFVARIDAAWSPDGVGAYALAGHVF